MNEIWKKIEEYDGDYLVSNFGRVKSVKNKNPKILKPGKNRGGYYYVILCKNSITKSHKVHRLVGNAFIPNPKNKPEINHLNGDKSNNHVTNLDWVTPKQNIQHAWQTGLMENTRKSVSIATEANKKPIYSEKLELKFNSIVEASIYLQSNYFENSKLKYLQTGICKLLLNQITKSKYDFDWKYQ